LGQPYHTTAAILLVLLIIIHVDHITARAVPFLGIASSGSASNLCGLVDNENLTVMLGYYAISE
jgi:hypothetical protein